MEKSLKFLLSWISLHFGLLRVAETCKIFNRNLVNFLLISVYDTSDILISGPQITSKVLPYVSWVFLCDVLVGLSLYS